MVMERKQTLHFYRSIKTRSVFDQDEIGELLRQIDRDRVSRIAVSMGGYIYQHLPQAIEGKTDLADYRTNPYVVMTSASTMDLTQAERFAEFLVNSKIYAGLETSFGRSLEEHFLTEYPVSADQGWETPPGKTEESEALKGLSNEEKALARDVSVWREVDKHCVVGDTRFLTTIKSGPTCINDTQVEAMKNAVRDHSAEWLADSQERYPGVDRIHYVVGLTYGTDWSTNNKENQILVKLLAHDFEEEDREALPGVLVDTKTGTIRVSRAVGRDFWAFIANPETPSEGRFAFLEILLALAKALSDPEGNTDVETRLNAKIQHLGVAISNIVFPAKTLPEWVKEEYRKEELVWLAAAMSAFYDEGI